MTSQPCEGLHYHDRVRYVLFFVALLACAEATAEICTGPARLDQAFGRRPQLVVAGVAEDVGSELRFHVDSVILGDRSLKGKPLLVDIRYFCWHFTVLREGGRCALVLDDKSTLVSVVPLVNTRLPAANDEGEAKETLKRALLQDIRREKSVQQQHQLILAVGPILGADDAGSLAPFVRSRDAWLRRAALAGVVNATLDPKYIRLAKQDIEQFVKATPADALTESGMAAYVAFFEHYFFLSGRELNDRDEGARGSAFLPLFRAVANSKQQWYWWDHGIGPLCRVGTEADARFLYERYWDLKDKRGGVANAEWFDRGRRSEIIAGLSRILGLGHSRSDDLEFSHVEDEQFRKVTEALLARSLISKSAAKRKVDYTAAISEATIRIASFSDAPSSTVSAVRIAGAYADRGRLYVLAHRYNEATTDFTRAIASEPRYFLHYAERGDTFAAQDQLDRALADYDKAMEVQPFPTTYHKRAVVLLKMGEFDRAIADETKALSFQFGTTGDNYPFHFIRGKAYLWMGQPDKALLDLREAGADRLDVDALYAQALTYYALGLFVEALAEYERALGMKPSAQAYEEFVRLAPEKNPADTRDVHGKILQLFGEQHSK